MADVVAIQRDDFHATDGEITGAEKEVWGKPILGRSDIGHLFIREDDQWQSLCGVSVPLKIWNGQNALFRVGSYPKCKRCMNLVRKR